MVSGFCASSWHFFTHAAMALPYGGLQNTLCPPQSCFSPSSSAVKYFGHLWFSALAQGSSVKWNSRSNSSKNACGVAHRSVVLLNTPAVSRLFLVSVILSLGLLRAARGVHALFLLVGLRAPERRFSLLSGSVSYFAIFYRLGLLYSTAWVFYTKPMRFAILTLCGLLY